MANSKRKLRDRTRTIEHERIATISSCDFCRQLGELFREESRIMGDHDFGLRRNSLAPAALLQVSNKPARGPIDIKKIHRIRADAREFRSFAFARVSAFSSGDDFTDSAPAKPTRAKFKRLVKPIVQFLPFAGANQFLDRSEIESEPAPASSVRMFFADDAISCPFATACSIFEFSSSMLAVILPTVPSSWL